MACINGTVWCKGAAGPSASLKCNACQKQALATVPVAPVAPVPLPAAFTGFAGTATPRETPLTRGSTGTTVHLGLGEEVDLANPVPPVGFSVGWSVSGDAQITNPTPKTALLTAGPTAGPVTASLKITLGPSNVGHVLTTLDFKVIAPTGTTTRQDQTQAGLRHTQGTAGVGFQMWVNLLPNDVVFNKLQWREHTGVGMGTGHFKAENGRTHAPTGVPYNTAKQPTNLLSADWMQVYGILPPPCGNNWVGQSDTVDTGDHPPDTPASPAGPATWKASSHSWNIEWRYRVQKADGTYSGEYTLERSMHKAKIETNGKATISKGGAGPFVKFPADADSTC